MRRYFTAGEVVRLTGVTYRRLDLWCRREIIQPSMRTARGRGQRRLFTFRDLVEIRTIKTLTAQGVRLAALLVAVNRIRRDFGDLDGSPLASARLVTDGRSVFRYVPARDHLERLDEYGQFAFAFDLGAEVAALRQPKENWQLPASIRAALPPEMLPAPECEDVEEADFEPNFLSDE